MIGGFSKATEMQREMSSRCVEELKRLLLGHILRRTKKQLKFDCNLPERKEYIVACPMTDSQLELYTLYVNHCLKMFSSNELRGNQDDKGNCKLLAVISGLRKIVNHPYLFY